MQLSKFGVFAFTLNLQPSQIAEVAQTVERLGYSALWYPESSVGDETFSIASFLLGNTTDLIIAAGIANIYARDGVTARQGQHTLSRLYGSRFLLGLGVTNPKIVEEMRGHHFGSPVPTMRAYLDQMDGAMDMAAPIESPAPLVLAALGPLMTKLAAQRTAGPFPYNVTPEHTAWARELVGPEPWVIVEQKVMLSNDATQARAASRQFMSRYMQMNHFRAVWKKLGFSEEDLAGTGSDRFIDAMVAWGNETTIRNRIQAHLDAGANHVCIHTVHPEGLPFTDMRALESLAP